MVRSEVGPGSQPHGMSLRHRVLLLTTTFLLLIVTVAVTAESAFDEHDAAVIDLEERIEPARAAVNLLVGGMTDQEIGLRGYLLTQDASFLEPYDEGAIVVDQAARQLARLVGDDPELGEAVTATVAAARAWQDEAAEPELALASSGRFEEAAEIVDVGRQRFDTFRSRARSLRQSILEVQRAGALRARDARQWLARLVYVMVTAAGVLTLLTAWLLRRWVTAPLSTMSKAVDQVTAGHLHQRIPAVGPRDLAALAANVDRMRARLVGALDEAVAAREALEQQGPAVVTLRSELAPSEAALPDTVALAASVFAAEGVLAGDWYDCVDLGDGRIALLVVDVSGHGPGAGVFALRAKHLLLAALREAPDPGAALNWLAENIGDTGERFVTGIVVEVDTTDGTVRWANAGHPSGVIVEGETLERLDATGPLLGPFPGTWTTEQTRLAPDGMLVVFTDGLVEARAGDEQFGDDRLLAVLLREDEPQRVLQAVTDAVRSFTGGPLDDDVTLVALQYRPADRPAPVASRGGATPAAQAAPSTSAGVAPAPGAAAS